MTQLDHMNARPRHVRRRPGALVHDAAKIGIKAAEQRDAMNESTRRHRRADGRQVGDAQDDWFDLTAAQLQLQTLQPAQHGDGRRLRPLAGWPVASGRHGIGMLSIGGTSDDALKAHAANWKIYTDHASRTARSPTAPSGASSPSLTWRRRVRQPSRGEVRPRSLHPVFHDVATFPILPPGITDAAEFLTKEGVACIGTPDDCIRHLERLGRARTAASARSCCWPTTGPTGRRRSVPTS